jgi:hypothetical protein
LNYDHFTRNPISGFPGLWRVTYQVGHRGSTGTAFVAASDHAEATRRFHERCRLTINLIVTEVSLVHEGILC